VDIKVVYSDDRQGVLKSYQLDKLISMGKIKKFCRSEGWVTIGVDPIRRTGGSYNGPERRESSTVIFL
jgi:hypothetical protein